jgi:hypothetical protein
MKSYVNLQLLPSEKENKKRSNEVEISASSIPIGEGMNTGNCSMPVNDSSENGIVMVGSSSKPNLERDQSFAFLTLDLVERLLAYRLKVIPFMLDSSGLDESSNRTIGAAHTLAILPVMLTRSPPRIWFCLKSYCLLSHSENS